ncbi:MAG: PDZ domain-containing protein [Flammeovirgaceae bacterium]
MYYQITCPQPTTHFLHLSLIVENPSETLRLQLAAWRPGRYQLQNYAKNIYSFEVFNESKEKLPFKKINNNLWEIQTYKAKKIEVRYTYLANKMDAGGSWVDEEQWYINWINCIFYVVGREWEKYQLHLDIPTFWKVASSLPYQNNILFGENYEDVIESPIICSPTLQIKSYTLNQSNFHIAIQGKVNLYWEKIIEHFEAFTKAQIQLFGDFPCKDYYFLYEIVPFTFYHGVEHTNSTIIVLGSDVSFNFSEKYKEFLGVSSHELFHTWNIKRIRPSEMQPYDYTKENYFPTGFVAEGITTYYGDLMLLRSGVFTWKDYADELNRILKLYSENYGKLSLLEASTELWIDGYEKIIPHRKPSIYAKGCLVSLILDLEIRKATQNQCSLDDVMRILWNEYKKADYKGYTLEKFVNIISEMAGKDVAKDWLEKCILGNNDLIKRLGRILNDFGVSLKKIPSKEISERNYGFRTKTEGNKILVVDIFPNSPAEGILSVEDELIAIDGRKIMNEMNFLLEGKKNIEISLFRNAQLKNVRLNVSSYTYFDTFNVEIFERKDATKMQNFVTWAGNLTR